MKDCKNVVVDRIGGLGGGIVLGSINVDTLVVVVVVVVNRTSTNNTLLSII